MYFIASGSLNGQPAFPHCLIHAIFGLIAATGGARPACNFVAIKTTIMATTMTMEESQEYLGTWVSGDGYIQHQLLPGNRYDEARGNHKSAYIGQYWVKGNHIEYKDDTGFTADGDFKNGILYHAGMILYKQKNSNNE
jgi:hypothetical protein